jgi:hypothetical protein
MNRLSTYGIVLGLAMTISPRLFAAAPYPANAKEVIERYVRLDADAAGLSPATWPELGAYTNFPEAPQWSSFVVIDRYEIGRAIEGHTRAQVRVTYYPLGQLSDKFIADSKPENVTFSLNKVDGLWRVDTPLLPHVSYQVMKRRLEASSAKNPKTKKSNDELLKQIEAARLSR